jgi:uncharacterized protein YecE (DUF72 family)
MIRIGTSGWVYPPWRGLFYPKGLAQRRELEYISRRLNSVEINGSFYALQHPDSYRKWFDQTPDDFMFALKGPRFITHMKRLLDIDAPLANFCASGILALRQKLGPILWQFPANFPYEPDRLAAFFSRLPRTTTAAATLAKEHDEHIEGRAWTVTDADRPLRHAIEVRHPGFHSPDYLKLLREHDIGLVVADTAGKFPYLEDVTSDFVYVRLHGDTELYASGYTDEALDRWAGKIRTWSERGDVHVYFDNDMKVKAPGDALSLAQRLAPS